MSRIGSSLIVAATLAAGIAIGAYGARAQQNQPHMNNALELLNRARNQLQAAQPNKGGHREKAIDHIDRAIQEVQAGISYANEHPNPNPKHKMY